MTTQEITDAIFYLVPNAEFSFQGTDLETLEWHTKDVEKPSIETILAAIPVAKKAKEDAAKSTQSEKMALLQRLGVTEDEFKLLLG